MNCGPYTPNPECHQGHAQASSVHDTAFTGGPMAGPMVLEGLLLSAAAIFFVLSKLFRRAIGA